MSYVNIHGDVITVSPTAIARTKGYAADPGTGPAGKTCKDCAHKRTIRSNSGSKSWVKCAAASERWTNGEGSDIKAGSPACRLFQGPA